MGMHDHTCVYVGASCVYMRTHEVWFGISWVKHWYSFD